MKKRLLTAIVLAAFGFLLALSGCSDPDIAPAQPEPPRAQPEPSKPEPTQEEQPKESEVKKVSKKKSNKKKAKSGRTTKRVSTSASTQ